MNYKKGAWYQCEHDWEVSIDSDLSNGHTEVTCTKCGCPGERNDKTNSVYWPTT